MPTYEYECLACAHRFEEFQSVIDKPLQNCPRCGEKVRRLISSGAGLLFKGSGFYITDYRSQAYKKKAKEEKTGSEGISKKEESQPKKKSTE